MSGNSLGGLQVKNGFGRLLQIANTNEGLDGTRRFISDGNGENSTLLLSNVNTAVNSSFFITNSPVTEDSLEILVIGSGSTSIRAVGSSSDISVCLQPKGTGSISSNLADNLITGGNNRGANSIDWQTIRTSATQVASGSTSTVSGGQNNTASGTNSTSAGGSTNTASGNGSTVAGGVSNTASGTNATVCGGTSNSAAVINSTVAGGNTNTANGSASWIPGGQHATTRSVIGRAAWASARISAQGDAQCGEHPLIRQTTNATDTRLTSDNAAATTNNTINMPNFSAYAGELIVVAKASGGTAAATWRVGVSAVRGNGAGTVVVYQGAGTGIVPTASNGTGSAWRLAIAADTSNGGISVTVTGAASTTINWSARFSNVESTTTS